MHSYTKNILVQPPFMNIEETAIDAALRLANQKGRILFISTQPSATMVKIFSLDGQIIHRTPASILKDESEVPSVSNLIIVDEDFSNNTLHRLSGAITSPRHDSSIVLCVNSEERRSEVATTVYLHKGASSELHAIPTHTSSILDVLGLDRDSVDLSNVIRSMEGRRMRQGDYMQKIYLAWCQGARTHVSEEQMRSPITKSMVFKMLNAVPCILRALHNNNHGGVY